jgi:hypothetical protein
MMTSKSADPGTLERGEIRFYYRPKIPLERAETLEDVASFLMILHPDSRPDRRPLYRIAAIGLKELLQPETGAGGWSAKLEAVEPGYPEVAKRLAEAHPIPAARPCGSGGYAISEHKGHTHLAYSLEFPDEPDEILSGLGLSDRANPVLAVVNPILEAREGAESPQVVLPSFPPELLAGFGDRRIVPANPVNLLDYEGVEILLADTAP